MDTRWFCGFEWLPRAPHNKHKQTSNQTIQSSAELITTITAKE
jgi:hypothetical protein